MFFKDILLAFFSFFLFGAWAAISRLIELSPFLMVFIMSASAFLVGSILGRPKLGDLVTDKRSLVVGLNLTADLILLIYAFRNLPISMVITLHFMGPLYLAVWQYIRQRRWNELNILIYVTFGFIGVVLVNIESLSAAKSLPFDGFLAALGSSITVAGNIVFQKKAVEQIVDASFKNITNLIVRYNFWILIFSGLLAIYSNKFFPIIGYKTNAIIYSILAGIFVQWLALCLFNRVVKIVPAAIMGLISFSEIIWSILIGVWNFNEYLSALQIFGFLIIFFAIIFGQSNTKKSESFLS